MMDSSDHVILSLYREISQKYLFLDEFDSIVRKVDECLVPLIIHFWKQALPPRRHGDIPECFVQYHHACNIWCFVLSVVAMY